MMKFEWDSKKAASNKKKHDVTFQEAATVFGDVLAITYHDLEHSVGEDRYCSFGMSHSGKPLVVCHTERADITPEL